MCRIVLIFKVDLNSTYDYELKYISQIAMEDFEKGQIVFKSILHHVVPVAVGWSQWLTLPMSTDCCHNAGHLWILLTKD